MKFAMLLSGLTLTLASEMKLNSKTERLKKKTDASFCFKHKY